MFAILLGETLTLPAREVSDVDLRARSDFMRTHNLMGAVHPDLAPGGHAKILRAFERKPGREWDPMVEVTFDEGEVRVTGISRGLTQVEIIDELSYPGGTTGMAGGVEVLVQDEYDRQEMMKVAEPA